MKTRLIASVALGAAVLLGTTGCNLIAPQATTIDYSASDGVNVPAEAGPLSVRNALIVANDDGTTGNLVAAIVNDTTEQLVLRIEVGEGSSAVRAAVNVPANRTLSLGDLERRRTAAPERHRRRPGLDGAGVLPVGRRSGLAHAGSRARRCSRVSRTARSDARGDGLDRAGADEHGVADPDGHADPDN